MQSYAAADPELASYERSNLGSVRFARWVLAGWAAFDLLCALGVPLGTAGVVFSDASVDPAAAPVWIGVALCTSLLLCGAGIVPQLFALAGLRKGAVWSWYLTVSLGGFAVLTACLPVGVALLAAMLRQPTRGAFLDP